LPLQQSAAKIKKQKVQKKKRGPKKEWFDFSTVISSFINYNTCHWSRLNCLSNQSFVTGRNQKQINNSLKLICDYETDSDIDDIIERVQHQGPSLLGLQKMKSCSCMIISSSVIF
jgi:hypothetical protein